MAPVTIPMRIAALLATEPDRWWTRAEIETVLVGDGIPESSIRGALQKLAKADFAGSGIERKLCAYYRGPATFRARPQDRAEGE